MCAKRYWQIVALLSAAFAGSAGGQTNPLAAEGITIVGVARAVSVDYFMRTICPKFFFVDLVKAEEAQKATMELGINFYGKDDFERTVVAELPRRQREVEATGTEMWCRYQRSNLIQTGKTIYLRP